MLGNLIKRKVDADKLANIFVNSILQITDHGFDDISEMILEDAAFVKIPTVTTAHSNRFTLIVIVGNMNYLDQYFESDELAEIKKHITAKFANIYGVTYREFEDLIKQTNSFISSVNQPSKNMLYGMSKAVFHKFNLNEYQEEHFKTLKTPNPMFLKRMDEVMSNFLWDWDQFFKRHKFNLN